MHQICYLTFSSRKGEKTIARECDQIAIRNGDTGHGVGGIRFCDEVLKNEDEARQWIDLHDNGWYDCLAVKFKEGRAVRWMVKIEFHC